MGYPKTIGNALDALQGNWKVDGIELSFTIEDLKITNPVGLIDSSQDPILHDTEFGLKRDKAANQWNIYAGNIFGFGSNIIEWTEEYFTTAGFPLLFSDIHNPYPPTAAQKQTCKFIKNHDE